MVSDRTVNVRLDADISRYKRAMADAASSTAKTGSEIDKLSGRLRLATDAALVFGPALGPLAAGAVGGVVALSAQLGSLAGGLGVTLLAVNGLGDGLDALNKYQLEPTEENAEKLREQLEKLGPSGQHFVFFLDSISSDLKSLQMTARDGLLPGAEEGIQHLLTMLPQLKSLVGSFATEVGDLMADSGEALAGPRFEAFFEYLDTDGARILDDTARTIGNLTEAAANLFVAFSPLTGDISGGLLEWSEGLAGASANLAASDGFQEFLDYIRTTGPQALETVSALANALLQIAEAAAPLGGPVLSALEGVAKAIAAIADSPLGTPIMAALAALSLLNLALRVTEKLTISAFGGPALAKMGAYVDGLLHVTTAQERAQMTALEMDAANKRNFAGLAKGGLMVAGLAASFTGLADKAGLSNTAMLSLLGPYGTAAGYALDFKAANDKASESIDNFGNALRASRGDIAAQQVAINSFRTEIEAAKDDIDTDSFGEFFKNAFDPDVAVAFTREAFGMSSGTDQMASAADRAQKELDDLRAGTVDMFNPMDTFGGALLKAGMAADQEAAAIRGAIDAMHDMRMEALRAKNAELDYQQSIDDATKAARENGRTVDKTTDAGRNNLRALYNLAGAWNSQSEVIKGNNNALQAAKRNFIATAESMGMAEGKARRLARSLFDIPEKRVAKVEAETAEAQARINAIKAALNSLHDKTVHVTTIGTTVKAAGGALTRAGGGLIVGPGGPRDDAVPVLASNREYMIQASAVEHYGVGFFDRLNAKRMANGGSVGGARGYSSAWGVGSMDDEVDHVVKGLKGLKAALEKAQKAVEKEKQVRDDLIQASKDFASQVGSAYAKADLFSGGLSDFDTGVSANINDTQAAQAALAAAAAQGLDGALYQALAASGNLTLLQEFAGLSAAEIAQREKQFAMQSNAQGALGGMAARHEYAQAIKEQTHELREAQKERRHLAQLIKAHEKATEKLPDKVEDGARKGIAERDRRTATRTRTG